MVLYDLFGRRIAGKQKRLDSRNVTLLQAKLLKIKVISRSPADGDK